LDKTSNGGIGMVRKTKGRTTQSTKSTLSLEAKGKATGTTKVGLHCIGEICFTEDGFLIKLPEDADPKCAKATADLILKGARVTFEVPGRGIVEDPTKIDEEDEEKA